MFPPHKKQSIYLYKSSMEWFLYEGNIYRQRVLRLGKILNASFPKKVKNYIQQ